MNPSKYGFKQRYSCGLDLIRAEMSHFTVKVETGSLPAWSTCITQQPNGDILCWDWPPAHWDSESGWYETGGLGPFRSEKVCSASPPLDSSKAYHVFAEFVHPLGTENGTRVRIYSDRVTKMNMVDYIHFLEGEVDRHVLGALVEKL